MKGFEYFIFLIFFYYKISDSLFQPSIRLYIYDTVVSIIKTNLVTNLTEIEIINSNISYDNYIPKQEDQKYIIYDKKTENAIQKQAVIYILMYRLLINLPAAILTLFWGSWSDKSGRKLTLLLPCIGGFISAIIMGFSYFKEIYETYWAICVIMISVLIYGLMGKSSLLTMSSNSYVIDCTDKEERTISMGRLLGFSFFGTFTGSFLIGIISEFSHFYTTLITVSSINALLSLIIIFILPESSKFNKNDEEYKPLLSTDNDNEIYNENNSFIRIYNFFKLKRDNKDKNAIILLLIAIFLCHFNKAGEQDIVLLYVRNPQIGWSNDIYGYYLATSFGCMGLNLLLILPMIKKCFSPSDMLLAIIGILALLARVFIAGSTNITWVLFLSVIIGSSCSLFMASTKSMLSQLFLNHEVGTAFSFISALEAGASLFGPLFYNLVYSITIDWYIGTVFYVIGFFYLCILMVFAKLQWSLIYD